ncbi:hypothetical protein ACFL5V_05505 [Fibrobacterota bacterium]
MALNKREPTLKTGTIRGYTLVELLVALSLSLLVVFFGFTLYLRFNRAVLHRQTGNHLTFQADIFCGQLRNQIMTGQGIVSVAEDGLKLLTERGKLMEYSFTTDGLTINQAPGPLKVDNFRVEALGPVIYYPEHEYFGSPPTPLQQLDRDRSGLLEMEELDLDGSGTLEGRECAGIGLINVSIEYAEGNKTLSRRIRAHPRNRLISYREEDNSESR